MKNLIGTEKQVTWANEIRSALINVINSEIEEYRVKAENKPERADRIMEKAAISERALAWVLDNAVNASWWIDNRDIGYGQHNCCEYPIFNWRSIRKFAGNHSESEINDSINNFAPDFYRGMH